MGAQRRVPPHVAAGGRRGVHTTGRRAAVGGRNVGRRGSRDSNTLVQGSACLFGETWSRPAGASAENSRRRRWQCHPRGSLTAPPRLQKSVEGRERRRSVAALLADGLTCGESPTDGMSSSDAVSKRIGERLLRGWTLRADACPRDNTPLMGSRDGQLYCACEDRIINGMLACALRGGRRAPYVALASHCFTTECTAFSRSRRPRRRRRRRRASAGLRPARRRRRRPVSPVCTSPLGSLVFS